LFLKSANHMKKPLLLIAVMLVCSCTNVNKPLTAEENDKVIGEAKVLISEIIQACEKSDGEMLKSMFINSPDFVSMVGGISVGYDQSLKNTDGYFASVVSQKSSIKSEKYLVLDAKTVLYTANSSWEATMKDGSKMVMDPTGMQFLLRKDGDRWKILSWTEEPVMK